MENLRISQNYCTRRESWRAANHRSALVSAILLVCNASRRWPGAREPGRSAQHAMSRHNNIIEILELLASEENQLAYERDVPHVDITAELVSMWFKDQYQLGKGFDAFFSPDELAALARFHRFDDERVDRLPERKGTVRTWLADSLWRQIMQQAEATLRQIAEPDTAPDSRPTSQSPRSSEIRSSDSRRTSSSGGCA